RDKLTKVIELCPNHLSAKLLALMSEDKQPRRLSSGASLYYTAVAIRTVLPIIEQQNKDINNKQITPQAIKENLRSLDKLRRLADPHVVPLVDAWRDFVKTLSDAQTGILPAKSVEQT